MILLEVPFAEKESAKAVGAKWNPVEKKWYVPESLEGNLALFEKWLPNHASQILISPNSNEATSSNDKEKGIPLSHLMHQVQLALRHQFSGAIWVTAEVANISERKGHLYFELTETTEEGQQIANCRAMIWQSQAERLLTKFQTQTGSELKTGQKILLLAEPSFHEKFGFSLVIQDIDPSFTLGELEAKLQAIRQQLVTEQLYDKNKRFPMPKDFFRVAVIAPPSAAGLGDFRADADELVKRKLCEFKYFYSAFQGENVESEMLLAFDAFLALHQTNHFDALIIIRGGGAKLDLQPLNNYVLAKAIAQLELPVLTGIGHERDNTLLDEVSAVRFDTPSKVITAVQQAIFTSAQQAQQNWLLIEKASMLYIQKQKQTIQELESKIQAKSIQIVHESKQQLAPLMMAIQQQSIRKLATQRHALDLAFDSIFHQASNQVQLHQQQLNQYHHIIEEKPQKILQAAQQSIKQLIGFILSSGPKTQLSRGFAMVKNTQNQLITSEKSAHQEENLKIIFNDGEVEVKCK